MSSVLIKGMNMPKDIAPNVHRTVTLIISGDGKIYDVNRNRLPAVAVEVPEPHGRLIDADEFIKMAKRDCEDCKTPNSDECLMCKEPAIEAIADLQPTVIEAEGDEHETTK